jgi:hypothetical protein
MCTAEARNADAETNAAGLAAMIEAWPKLPEPIKAGILAMIRAALMRAR